MQHSQLQLTCENLALYYHTDSQGLPDVSLVFWMAAVSQSLSL